MIDYIEISRQVYGKDSLFLEHLQPEASYSNGWRKYSVKGCRKLEVWHNADLSLLRLRGSIMYYWQGHNFSFDKLGFVQAINYLSSLMQMDLWSSEVDAFEYGAIVELTMGETAKEYVQHHREGKGLDMYNNPKDKGHFRGFKGAHVHLKLYDAGRNIQHKQGLSMKGIIQSCGWNTERKYLKFEVHYLKPHISLNNGKGIELHNLVNPEWEKIFKEDLCHQYKRLMPMKSIVIPTNKKDLSSADIVLFTLAEWRLNEGDTVEEVKKVLYSRINSIPAGTLSVADKKARKRQIKTMLNKVEASTESKWDLSDKLAAILIRSI